MDKGDVLRCSRCCYLGSYLLHYPFICQTTSKNDDKRMARSNKRVPKGKHFWFRLASNGVLIVFSPKNQTPSMVSAVKAILERVLYSLHPRNRKESNWIQMSREIIKRWSWCTSLRKTIRGRMLFMSSKWPISYFCTYQINYQCLMLPKGM